MRKVFRLVNLKINIIFAFVVILILFVLANQW